MEFVMIPTCRHVKRHAVFAPHDPLSQLLRDKNGKTEKETFRLVPSNGRAPLTSVYKMTPRLHTSTSGPSYCLPWNSSGAAYGGLPQNVLSFVPGLK